jgi:hypothetical protein
MMLPPRGGFVRIPRSAILGVFCGEGLMDYRRKPVEMTLDLAQGFAGQVVRR